MYVYREDAKSVNKVTIHYIMEKQKRESVYSILSKILKSTIHNLLEMIFTLGKTFKTT